MPPPHTHRDSLEFPSAGADNSVDIPETNPLGNSLRIHGDVFIRTKHGYAPLFPSFLPEQLSPR